MVLKCPSAENLSDMFDSSWLGLGQEWVVWSFSGNGIGVGKGMFSLDVPVGSGTWTITAHLRNSGW